MAEFQTVLRQWRRMCTANQCKNCPGRSTETQDGVCMLMEDGYQQRTEAECESIIMEWAAEHPEPVYPTWGEWLEQQGICFSHLTNYSRVDSISIPQVFNYQIEGKTAFICGDKVNEPIPADIAQKLGIEPKEG